MSAELWASDPEPPVGSHVIAVGTIWVRQPEGYWIAEDSDEPESWTKVAGNYGPAVLVREIRRSR